MAAITRRPPDVVSDDAVLEVLGSESLPVSTLLVRRLLAERAHVSRSDVVTSRLRRALDRLEAEGLIVASGGKRDVLPGWPATDRRNVLWATHPVAEKMRRQHEVHVQRQADEQVERVKLLREMHRLLTHNERIIFNLVGVTKDLSHDPAHVRGDGATTWSLDELRIVVAALTGDG